MKGRFKRRRHGFQKGHTMNKLRWPSKQDHEDMEQSGDRESVQVVDDSPKPAKVHRQTATTGELEERVGAAVQNKESGHQQKSDSRSVVPRHMKTKSHRRTKGLMKKLGKQYGFHKGQTMRKLRQSTEQDQEDIEQNADGDPVHTDNASPKPAKLLRSTATKGKHEEIVMRNEVQEEHETSGHQQKFDSGAPRAECMLGLTVLKTSSHGARLVGMIRSIVPELTRQLHKGQAGRIGVIGGCKEYTGAPYFAAISALKVGADLSHVICTSGAAPVIKSYSPELIVLPILDHENALMEIGEWLPRLHALVIGPGLGRAQTRFEILKIVIEKARKLELPLIIDADGVVLISQCPDLIHGYTKTILTPNKAEGEFVSLFKSVMGKDLQREGTISDVQDLARALGHVTIVRKGSEDVICNGHNIVLVCDSEGSPRRCGGQGDLLSGSMGTFAHWAQLSIANKSASDEVRTFGPWLCAAYGACLLTRECGRQAFADFRRTTTTSDMIGKIQPAFEELFQ